VEPALIVIGLNFRSAPLAVRERFWIPECDRAETLHQLAHAEGIEEALVLATCNRTEFILWASDPALAANSVLQFLGAERQLKLCEWKHFYRLLDEEALLHVFRVASSLDSIVIGEPQIVCQVKTAWQIAREQGTSGRFLDAVVQKALTVSKRARNETAIGNSAVSIPYAAVETAYQLFGSLAGRKVLLLGAGKMGELSARYLAHQGVAGISVSNRTVEHAHELAKKLGGVVVPFEERWQHLQETDIVISSTSSPHTILNRAEAELIVRERNGRPLCLVDIAVPRNIDPAVRGVPGIYLYDVDDLKYVVQHNAAEREAAAAEAEVIVAAEAKAFRRKLLAERVVPTIVALRERLDEICRQELESFRQEYGPFPKDQEQLFGILTSHFTKKLAGALARELKELPEKVEQEQMTHAVERLFHLETPRSALAGTSS
jgi:glutamyl-tRNA reductase